MKHVTYRVPDDFSERLKLYAKRRRLSLNKAIDQALDEALCWGAPARVPTAKLSAAELAAQMKARDK